jgi:hypothetical protein
MVSEWGGVERRDASTLSRESSEGDSVDVGFVGGVVSTKEVRVDEFVTEFGVGSSTVLEAGPVEGGAEDVSALGASTNFNALVIAEPAVW